MICMSMYKVWLQKWKQWNCFGRKSFVFLKYRFRKLTDILTRQKSITESTYLLRKQNYFLLQQNASKNAIIKLLAENQQYAKNTKEADSKLSMVLIQNCQRYFYKKTLQTKMTFYATDDSDGSDFSSDAETLPSGSTSWNNNNNSNRKKKKLVEKSGK